MAEGSMSGKGTKLTCQNCGKQYELTEYGYMEALEGETEFPHIPDWYKWQRECVKKRFRTIHTSWMFQSISVSW